AVGREQVPDHQEGREREHGNGSGAQSILIEAIPAQRESAERRRLPRRREGRRRFGDRCGCGHGVLLMTQDGRAAHVLPPPVADFTASSKPITLPLILAAWASASFFRRKGAISPPPTAKKAWSANSLMPRVVSKT